jgi:hypothetical protein
LRFGRVAAGFTASAVQREGVTPFGGDLLDPRSRHNVYVSGADDVAGVGPWSADALLRAVRRADGRPDGVVVVDHGRERLYLAAGTGLRYDPPRALGVAAPPALVVDDPDRYDPDDGVVHEGPDRVTVSPAFDLLVPAFDFPDDAEDAPPPLGGRRTGDPAGAGRGTPG